MSLAHVLSRLALLGACLACAAVVHAQSSPASDQPTAAAHRIADLGYPVPFEKLAAVRGGFDLGDGLEVSFGIERAVYINGDLVTYSSVNIPDVAHITTQQATALASALGTVNVVQDGPGNTFDPSSMGQTAAATVIQNTLNNQTIRSLTTLNVSVNTLNAFRGQGLQQALQAVQVQALGH
ncbi:hypothetical protein [Dyella psychrodurans]|uniref:Uncharacterized protein n=1 Tax=Dyella psychrodurans TaxID=1927960 RepID=A0A370WWD7_9GAMM|nr:hypothetical protein [Dyella psychrodurans]RDS80275.1 hypothetical protein DWU99_19275 [Dyella psychrodurans]